jgi:hypothetical protein
MSLYPTHNKNNNSGGKGSSQVLFAARVKDILLSNEQKLFKQLKGWADIGTIQFKPLFKSIDIDSNSKSFAKPLFSNIKQYPLKEEIILIINAPSNNLNNNPNAHEFYYFPLPISIWNSNHHNSFPDIPNYNFEPKELNLGNIFKEKDGIKNLLPEEGDVIFEGRFGNSIRFSSTSKNGKNPWSDVGENGDPITIIRNGQILQPESSPWTPIYEDINGDDSSIYLTSGQEIPLELACKNLKSFDITLSNSFNSSLQIPDANSF